MKKIRISLILLFVTAFSLFSFSNIYASIEDLPLFYGKEQISPEQISIKLNSSSRNILKEIRFKANGLYMSNDTSSKLLSSETSFVVKSIPKIYVDNIKYHSISQAGIKNSDLDFVYTQDLNEFKLASIENKYENEVNDAIGIYDDNGNLLLVFSAKSNIHFESSDFNPIEVFDKKYRGALRFINNNDNLSVINYVNIEEYLLGVVPREMSASWNIEALKAQAIAARSFAYSNYSKFSNSGFNLTDDTRSQVYGGFSAEKENSTRAVYETKGIVGYYDGKIAQLIYNASSGGKTESSKNVWGGDIPYLIAKDDPFSIGNPYDNWNVSLTASEIEAILKSRGNDIGKLESVEISQITNQGYVLSITFNGSIASKTFKKDAIRGIFGASKLKSLKFKISHIDGVYNFFGSGYGHGVGMSQYGAKTMAEQGFNYAQILAFYYPNVVLMQVK